MRKTLFHKLYFNNAIIDEEPRPLNESEYTYNYTVSGLKCCGPVVKIYLRGESTAQIGKWEVTLDGIKTNQAICIKCKRRAEIYI